MKAPAATMTIPDGCAHEVMETVSFHAPPSESLTGGQFSRTLVQHATPGILSIRPAARAVARQREWQRV
jgi:hypothetical protein